MKLLKKKLKNTGGATMLLALLFFLLCTVVASILIVASTVNSGRLSKLAKSDARYYAVESAAELFCDSINGKTVTVEKTKITPLTATTTYVVGVDTERGTPVPGSVSDYSLSISYDGTDGNTWRWGTSDADGTRGKSLLTDLALDLTAGEGVILAWNAWEPTITATEYNMTVSTEGNSNLNVTAKAELATDGVLTIELKNASESEDQYQMTLTFDADLQQVNTSSVEEGTPTVVKNANGTFTETILSEKTEKKTYTVCWHLTSVERGEGNA